MRVQRRKVWQPLVNRLHKHAAFVAEVQPSDRLGHFNAAQIEHA